EAWKDQATISLDITGKKCAADLVYDFIMASGMPYSAELEHLKDSAHSHDLWIRDVEDGEQLTSVISIMGAEKAFDALVKDLSLVYHE
ncbi:hypothetical protein, partial [Streptomyces galilaeus]|uniref:hypothetical protein n=1 Tax=Streptomyces galilaeus TaxID=33899 RepID=UPI0038F6AC69